MLIVLAMHASFLLQCHCYSLPPLLAQVVRILRLTEADVQTVAAFQGRHAEAKKDGYGHLLRSPTMWEDLVKSITLCNCGWGCHPCTMVSQLILHAKPTHARFPYACAHLVSAYTGVCLEA